MARTPEGAALIDNPVSAAPGFQVENVFVMAGVPKIMQAMFESLRERLVGGDPLLSRSIACQLPEGKLAQGLGEIQARHEGVDIGSYPVLFQRGLRGGRGAAPYRPGGAGCGGGGGYCADSHIGRRARRTGRLRPAG